MIILFYLFMPSFMRILLMLITIHGRAIDKPDINRSQSNTSSLPFHYTLTDADVDRLYCYAQKHVRSIKAVTKDPGEITEKRYRSIRRPLNKPNKKLKIRNFHHSSPYHVSDHKAAITVVLFLHLQYLCHFLYSLCMHSGCYHGRLSW